MTIVGLLTRMNPYVNIIGVDIDSVTVDLGRKYFRLNEYKNLKIEIADAFEYIKNTKQQLDLIIVDLFIRDIVPLITGDNIFLKKVLSKVNERGYVIINRLYLPEFKKETDGYIEFLKNEEKNGKFKIQDIFQNFGNKVILLRKI